MSSHNEIVNFIVGAVIIIVIFAIAYDYLKPHRLNKRRLFSTMLLKVTYLINLLNLLVVFCLSILLDKSLLTSSSLFSVIAISLIIMLPTAGVMLRKLPLFSDKRDTYNYTFTTVNIASSVILFLMFII